MERVIEKIVSAKKDGSIIEIALQTMSASMEITGTLETIRQTKESIMLEVLGIKSETIVVIKIKDVIDIKHESENSFSLCLINQEKISLNF